MMAFIQFNAPNSRIPRISNSVRRLAFSVAALAILGCVIALATLAR